MYRFMLVWAVAAVACSRSVPVTDWTAGPSVADSAFVSQSLWNDGKAELAFYRLDRKTDDGKEESIPVGTILLKHDFDPQAASKASEGGVPSFKWIAFFSYLRGSEEFKESYVVNSVQANLRPLKVSRSSFDWCSNQYLETSFLPNGHARFLQRSDDYGNASSTFEPESQAYPFAQVPWLVRSLAIERDAPVKFVVMSFDGKQKAATVTLGERQKRKVGDREIEVDPLHIRYEKPAPSLWTSTPQTEETYFRATDPARTLVAAEGEGYRWSLVETVRSAYWAENVFERLREIRAHP